MWVLLPLLLLFGCESTQLDPWKKIEGRDGRELYQARVPEDWSEIEVPRTNDSREPIGQFEIDGITIWVHNFPGMRIPPMAQVARWKRQNENAITLVVNEAHGGFAGLRFEAETDTSKVIAWAMQIDHEHNQVLANLRGNHEALTFFSEMRSDYTIKASGAQDAMERHDEAIRAFARTFELIQPIPRRR